MDLYSVLVNGFKDCNNNESDIQTPGVIDVTGISFDAKVAKVTRSNFIPILPLSMESALPPEVVAKILGQLMNDLTWTKVAIVYANDEHSTHVVKLLGQATLQTTICFVLSQPMPQMNEMSDWSKSSPNNHGSDGSGKHKELFDLLISSLAQDTPVLVIGSDVSTKYFMQLLHIFPDKSAKLQWLFSSLPEPSFFRSFDSHINNQKIYSLAPFPGKFSKFEEHWKMLQLPEPGPILGSWFDEYICQEKGCEKSHAMDRLLHESELDVLWRTYLIIPIVHSIFTFSHAIRNSWIEECAGMRGLCPSLKAMKREEFVNRFLEPLLEQVTTASTEYNESSSSYDINSLPKRGGRRNEPGSKSSELGKLNWKLALTSFHLDESEGLSYRQYILYDSVSTEAHLLDKDLPFTQSTCPSSGCKNCVKIRQAKQDSISDSSHFSNSFIHDDDDEFNSPPSECINQCGQCWSRFVHNNQQLNSSSFARENEVSSQTSVHVSQSLTSNFKKTWGIITAVSSSIGLICVLICASYFLMVFPLSIGTTILGYMILFGLIAIYAVNFLFVLTPSSVVCWMRKIGMSIGYCTILSGMLVKTMNAWRRKVNKSKRVEDLKMTSPTNLLLVSLGLVAVHLVVTLAWLNLFPPKPGFYESSWRCYPPSSSGFLIDTESVVSLLYIILLIIITIFFCILTWKSSDVNREPRYILFSCIAVASVWITWTFVAYKMRKRVAESRDVTIICANLASASLVMILLYLRKLYWYAKIKKKDRLVRARLHASNFPANFYGTIHARHASIDSNAYPWDAMSYVSGGQSTTTSSIRGSISSIKGGPTLRMAVGGNKGNKRPFTQSSRQVQEEMDDGTASCASATSSVQVRGEDLYPMEVYEGESEFQPSSLFNTTGNTIYAKQDGH